MIFDFLFCLGLVWILRFGSILNKPRNFLKRNKILKELLNCSLCLGFWAGVLLSVLYYKSSSYSGLHILMMPFASAGVCWFFDSLLAFFQLNTPPESK